MLQCALETGSLYAGEALLRHAIEIRETSPDIKKNRTIEGILHLHLANVLLARKANVEAEQERQKAAALIDHGGLPPQFELTVQLERRSSNWSEEMRGLPLPHCSRCAKHWLATLTAFFSPLQPGPGQCLPQIGSTGRSWSGLPGSHQDCRNRPGRNRGLV